MDNLGIFIANEFEPKENLSSFESDERNRGSMNEVSRVSRPKFILNTLDEGLTKSKSKNSINSSDNANIFEINIEELKDPKDYKIKSAKDKDTYLDSTGGSIGLKSANQNLQSANSNFESDQKSCISAQSKLIV